MAEITGGEKLERYLTELGRKLSSASSVKNGFLAKSTYPDGTSVAMVAALNNFGTGRMPPRPFFSNMVAEKSPTWGDGVAKALEASGNDASKALALVGEGIKGQLQQSIVDYDAGPPLAASTVRRKGNAKQLIDSGVMVGAVDYEVKS